MRLFITESGKEKKCGGCNWKTETFYGAGDTLKEAKKSYGKDKEYGQGLCANCICEYLVRYKANLLP